MDRRLVECLACGHEIATRKPKGEGIQCWKCGKTTFCQTPTKRRRKLVRCKCGRRQFTAKKHSAMYCTDCRRYHGHAKEKDKNNTDNPDQ